MSLTWSETLKTGFLVTGLNYSNSLRCPKYLDFLQHMRKMILKRFLRSTKSTRISTLYHLAAYREPYRLFEGSAHTCTSHTTEDMLSVMKKFITHHTLNFNPIFCQVERFSIEPNVIFFDFQCSCINLTLSMPVFMDQNIQELSHG